MSAAVGADIESLCRKCGDVWHVVVAKDGEKIAKVQCKQCGGYHKHRPPGSSKSASSRSKSTRSSAKKTKTVTPRIDEPQVTANDKPSRPYKFSDTWEPGDRIEHPKFGFGVVEITAEPGKMQVFFPDGRRVLAVAKKKKEGGPPPLTRPSRSSVGDREPPKW